MCLEHGALLGNWDKGMPQGQGLQVCTELLGLQERGLGHWL